MGADDRCGIDCNIITIVAGSIEMIHYKIDLGHGRDQFRGGFLCLSWNSDPAFASSLLLCLRDL